MDHHPFRPVATHLEKIVEVSQAPSLQKIDEVR
jgi:hypothetical protein